MELAEYPPSAALSRYIRAYYHIHVDAASYRFPADGCPGLIINLGQPLQLDFARGRAETVTHSHLFGFLSRRLVAHSGGSANLLAVKFRHGQLGPFFRVPGRELVDTCVALQDVWGVLGKELEERISEATTISDVVTLVDGAFARCLANDLPIDERVHRALNALFTGDGTARVEQIATCAGVSRRQLERLFLHHVGLTPKRMCRVARLTHAIRALRAKRCSNWADIAFLAGYSDQAHFIREWKFFTGSSPVTFLDGLTPLEATIIDL